MVEGEGGADVGEMGRLVRCQVSRGGVWVLGGAAL